MFDDDHCEFEDFLLLGGIYLFAEYMERKERELSVGNPEYAPGEASAAGWGCLITIGIVLVLFLIL